MDYNFIVINGNNEERDKKLFFDDEDIIFISNEADMFDVLVIAKLFKSKSEARKNWKRTGKDIPKGFTCLERLGMLKHNIYILNPLPTKEL